VPELLVRFSVEPAHAQVALADPRAAAYPEWDSGREPVTATEQVIVVATRPDVEGDVKIEVWTGPAEFRLGTVVFDGPFLLAGPEASVGCLGTESVRAVELGAGEHRVRIFVDEPGYATQVAFAVS
jgi:hypothetical protein